MIETRSIQSVIQARPTLEGAGVRLRRAFGFHEVPQFDPFLLLDEFRSADPADYLPGFPWHPHRGIETITYMLEGEVEHGDSMGNRGSIRAGDVQWMTAGSGVIHQEMPKGDGQGRLWGLQLWSNLPAAHKMMNPRYREVRSGDIPRITLDNGAVVRIVCGEVAGVDGPVTDILTDPEYLDVTLPASSHLARPIQRGHTAFAYVLEGKAFFSEERDPYAWTVESTKYFDTNGSALIGAAAVVLFADGDQILVTSEDSPVRFLLVSGAPLKEPIAWEGPIVMNTQEELRQAFAEYREGTFVKVGAAGS
jgi:quercetin 2,3-dioxygenase